MRKIKPFLILFLCVCALAVQGKIIAPQTPDEQANLQVKPLGVDGKVLEELSGQLSLEQCIEIALKNSPAAVSAQLQVQSAHVEVNLAKSNFLPTASAGAQELYSVHKTDGSRTQDGGTGSVYASANLSISGITELARNVKMKQVSLTQAELAFESVKNDIIRTVKKHYYALVTAQRAVDIRIKSRDVYKEQYERTAEYFKLGLRPKVDVTTAEVNLNNEELRLIRAKNLVKTASATLANTLGVTSPDVLQIAQEIDFDKWTISFEDAIKTAYENRPDVDSSRLGIRLNQMKLNQAKGAFFPTFSFQAGFTKSGDDFRLDNEDTRLMIGVELPLFNAFKTYNGVKQAKLALDGAYNSNRSLLNNVFLEVQNAYTNMQEAAESIPIAELNVEKAKENLDLAQGRYNEGIGDMIELKDAESAYTDAELSLLTARFDYGAAVADLKQAMGTY